MFSSLNKCFCQASCILSFVNPSFSCSAPIISIKNQNIGISQPLLLILICGFCPKLSHYQTMFIKQNPFVIDINLNISTVVIDINLILLPESIISPKDVHSILKNMLVDLNNLPCKAHLPPSTHCFFTTKYMHVHGCDDFCVSYGSSKHTTYKIDTLYIWSSNKESRNTIHSNKLKNNIKKIIRILLYNITSPNHD